MVGLLDKLQSSYFPAFQAMFRDIGAGEDPQVFSYTDSTFLFSAGLSSSLISAASSPHSPPT